MGSRYIDKIRKVMGRSLTCMIIAGMLTAPVASNGSGTG